jgi:hypothetical protein
MKTIKAWHFCNGWKLRDDPFVVGRTEVVFWVVLYVAMVVWMPVSIYICTH